MDSFWDIVGGAPWWVYVLFIYLMIVGIKSTKPRTISIKKVFILPLLFLTWSLYNLNFGVLSLTLVWFVFLFLGCYLGIRDAKLKSVSKNRYKGEITIPGTYSNLVLFLFIRPLV